MMDERKEIAQEASGQNDFGRQDLKEIQRSTLNLLKVFDCVCKRENIPYYIMGGTLLGAVRHKGFIPWDDDADVALFREDYRRLETVLIENPPAGTYWESVANPEHCPSNHFFGKLCLKETDIVDRNAVEGSVAHHFGIDVFPLDVRPEGFWKCQKQRFLSYYYNHLCPLLFGGSSNKYRFVKCLARRILAPLYESMDEVVKKFNRVVECENSEEGGCRISLCGRYGYYSESYLSEWFSHTVEFEFEDTVLPAAAGWNEILNKVYGKDWRVPRMDKVEHRHYSLKNE